MIEVKLDEFEVIQHPNFILGNHTNGYDVALIILKYVKFNHAVSLPKIKQKLPNEFIRMKFSKSSNKYSTHIEETNVKLINWESCVKTFPEYKSYEQSDRFCAYNGGKFIIYLNWNFWLNFFYFLAFTEVGNSGSSLLTRNGDYYVIHGVYSSGPSEGFTRPDMYMQMMSKEETVAAFDY